MSESVYLFEFPAPPLLVTPRNANFDSFIQAMRELAEGLNIKWHIALDSKGVALKGHAWNLREIVNDGNPKTATLRTLSQSIHALEALAVQNEHPIDLSIGPVSKDWQDLIKAIVVEYLVVRKRSIGFATAASGALRFLATIANKEPWLITSEDVQSACKLSDDRQPSKGVSIVLQGILSTVVDNFHLFDSCPLMGLVNRSKNNSEKRSKFFLAQDSLAKTLSERKAEQKLPEQRAFWELVRIVFTETPQTLNDALRFAMAKVLIFSGLRVNEVAFLPLDWRRTRSYIDSKGKPAGESGGFSESLMLRHFAEKQGTNDLYETTQFVPEMFREELERTLAQVAMMTAPLRTTLRAQYESGRLFPMYEPDALVDAVEMYVRLTGNPLWALETRVEVAHCVERYQESWDPSELLAIQGHQFGLNNLAPRVSRFFSPENRENGLFLRDREGNISSGRGVKKKFLRISEVEAYIRKHVPTKVPDLQSFKLDNGTTMAPWEMLFLLPKRAVGAGRGESVLDPNMTYSVGVADGVLLQSSLGDVTRQAQSLFTIYGKTEEDRQLKILSHSFRHLQNTELFRLGVADTIITKRFNRRSVAQSYEYDHRSLAEEMDQLELPDAWAEYLGDSKATTVAKMVQAGRASGPIVREFRRIQKEEGDQAALQFLAVEADGFHATPYGHCLNSFTVDPCPQHLECFSGCRHLSATNLPENRKNLIELRGKLRLALDTATARPPSTIGRDNQIAHAKVRLDGVEQLLATPAGEQVFPDGVDLSKSTERKSVLSGT